MINKLTRKIWFDENSQPPKDYIWYKQGAFYQWIDGKWKKVHDLTEDDGSGSGYYTGTSTDEVENPKEGDIFVVEAHEEQIDGVYGYLTGFSDFGYVINTSLYGATVTAIAGEGADLAGQIKCVKQNYITYPGIGAFWFGSTAEYHNADSSPIEFENSYDAVNGDPEKDGLLSYWEIQLTEAQNSCWTFTATSSRKAYEYVDGEWQNRNELKAVQNRLTTIENELGTKQVTTVKDKATAFMYAQTLENEGDIMYAPSKTTYLNRDNLTYTPPMASSVCTINAYKYSYLSNLSYTHIIIGTQFGDNKTPSYKIYQKTSYGDVYLLNLSTNEESVLSSNSQDPTQFSLSWQVMGTKVYIEDFTPENASPTITSLLSGGYIIMSIEEDGVYYEKYRGKVIERPDLSVISSIENKQNVYSENINNISNPKEGDIWIGDLWQLVTPEYTSGSYSAAGIDITSRQYDMSEYSAHRIKIDNFLVQNYSQINYSDGNETINIYDTGNTTTILEPGVTTLTLSSSGTTALDDAQIYIERDSAPIKEYYNGQWVDRVAPQSVPQIVELSGLPTAEMTTQSELDAIGLTKTVIEKIANYEIAGLIYPVPSVGDGYRLGIHACRYAGVMGYTLIFQTDTDVYKVSAMISMITVTVTPLT